MLSHTYSMERKSFGRAAVVAALVAISTVNPLAAMAEPTPAPTSDPARNPMEQFRIDRDNYNNAMKMRSQY
jgi:hypothetical protein